MQFILRFATLQLAIFLRNIKNRTSKVYIIKCVIAQKILVFVLDEPFDRQ